MPVQPSISFTQHLDENSVQTLSRHNADEDGIITGFLYVPDLDPTDVCYNISQKYVPANVTRQANLPPTDFTLVAIAPWISAECTKAYFAAVHYDPARAFIFYLPDNSTTQPPSIDSEAWDLDDGGAWMEKVQVPVYAVSGYAGMELMEQSVLYSGNMTTVPHGHEISELAGIDPRDYVRMYITLSTDNTTVLPGIWAFILIVLACFAIMLGLTSISLHLILRSRRKSLRRRVANGQVDLEALGIKRLTVPEDIIQKLPMFTYSCRDETSWPAFPGCKTSQNATVREVERSSQGSSNSKDFNGRLNTFENSYQDIPFGEATATFTNSSLAHQFLPDLQPTCAICLDDFESGLTLIRELLCGHIFHPECIDPFLSNSSSLCPMCKKTVLPRGYCPTKITNSMVRRERNLRRLRSRIIVSDEEAALGPEVPKTQLWRLGSSLRRAVFHQYTGQPLEPHMSDSFTLRPHRVLMTNALPHPMDTRVLGNELSADGTQQLPSRQEVAQQRIQEFAAQQTFIEDSDTIHRRPKSRWRRTVALVFPGLS